MLIMLSVSLIACSNKETQQTVTTQKENGVEVIYFHGKQRCATCVAIERETEAVINEQFADAVGSGALEYRIIDITKAENEPIADKYEVSWSSLVLVKYTDGEEEAENLTQFAFGNARNNPELFRKQLTEKINQLLQ